MYTNTFSPNYIVSKVKLVDKGYEIDLQLYLTSSFVHTKVPNFDHYYFFINFPNENK